LNKEDYLKSLTLWRISNITWKNKLFVFSFSSFFALLSIIISLLIPNQYTSTALVTFPKDSNNITSQFSGLSSLGSLAGISLPEDDSMRDFKEAIQFMNSKSFIFKFLDEKGYLPKIMAVKSWSASDNKFSYKEKIYNPEENKWTREVAYPRTSKPTPSEIAKIFHKNFFSSEFSLKDETLLISFSFYSPFEAQKILDELIKELNENLRSKKIDEIDKKINYINEKLSSNQIESVKEFFSKELETELAKRIIAVNKTDFIFKVIDEPSLTLKKTKPSRSIIVIFSTFIGFIFSIIIISFMSILNGHDSKFNFKNRKFNEIY
tara:strand:- start:14284 stop:15246 length:963 start_codon:yes stop_codon:yes gene_type:complete